MWRHVYQIVFVHDTSVYFENIYPNSRDPVELVVPLRNISNDTGPVALRGLR
jgi:hypothetical protein